MTVSYLKVIRLLLDLVSMKLGDISKKNIMISCYVCYKPRADVRLQSVMNKNRETL